MAKKYDTYGNEIPKRKRKAWVNTAIYVVAGVAIGSAIAGTASYFLFSNKQEPYVELNASAEPITYSFDSTNPETKLEGPFHFEVVEYGTWYGPIYNKDNSIQFLGKDGIQKLVNRMASDLVFGPEIMNLKKIYINNQFLTSENENGIYFPATNEIGINTNNMAEKLYRTETGNRGPFQNFMEIKNDPRFGSSIDYRVELVFQTLAHEYGHHIAHSYMTSSFDNYTNNIFTGEGRERRRDNWNNHFINTFKTSLDYDHNTDPIASNTQTLLKNNAGNITEAGMTSIGGIYDAEDLYSIANGRPSPIFNQNNSMVFADVDEFNKDNTIFSKVNKINNDDLQYLYSMQELSTRKYQQIFEKETPESIHLYNHGLPGSNTEDQIHYETPLFGQQFPSYKSSRFLEDNVYNEQVNVHGNAAGEKPADDLFNELKLQMGIDKNLSFIWGQNNAYVGNDMRIKPDANRGNNNLIKVGGYINSAYNQIGYLDDQGNFQKIDDIDVLPYNFGMKQDLFSSTWLPTTKTLSYTWASRNFIDVNQYANKQLVFHYDSTQPTNPLIPPVTTLDDLPLTSARASANSGIASNYMSHLPTLPTYGKEEQLVTGTFYNAYEENGGVVIKPTVRRAEGA